MIGLDRFGASGKGAEVMAHFGFTAARIQREITELLGATGRAGDEIDRGRAALGQLVGTG